MNWKLQKKFNADRVSSKWTILCTELEDVIEFSNRHHEDKYNLNQRLINAAHKFTEEIKDHRRLICPIIMIKDDKIIIENGAANEPITMIEIINKKSK